MFKYIFSFIVTLAFFAGCTQNPNISFVEQPTIQAVPQTPYYVNSKVLVQKYYDYFERNWMIGSLVSEQFGDFSDEQIVQFTVMHLIDDLVYGKTVDSYEDDPIRAYDNGIPIKIVNDFTRKVFGRTVYNYDTDISQFNTKTGLLELKLGFDPPVVFYVLKDYCADESGLIHAHFYGWWFSETIWDYIPFEDKKIFDQKIMSGDTYFFPEYAQKPMLIEMTFEEKEENGEMYLKYHNVWLVEPEYSDEIVPYSD